MRKNSLLMGVVAAVAAGLAFVYVDSRDAVAQKQAAIEDAWDQATAVIAARSELVTPLADAIQRQGPLESRLLMNVVEARATLENSAERPEKIVASMRLTTALAELLAAAEHDPALQSDATLKRLQDQLAEAENRMAAGRRRYNQAVQDYNTYIQLFPTNLVASLAGFTREGAYFRTTEQDRLAAPPLKFSQEPTETEEEAPAE
jgi:LemA protein